jgi:polyphosphate kinase 2 (PPK2 family)
MSNQNDLLSPPGEIVIVRRSDYEDVLIGNVVELASPEEHRKLKGVA